MLVRANNSRMTVNAGADQYELKLVSAENGRACIIDKGVRQVCQYHRQGDHLYLQAFGQTLTFQDITHQPASGNAASGTGQIKATMDGALIDLLVEQGQTVKQGDTLVILEAMKMEHPVKADRDGTLTSLRVSRGDQVKRNQLLAEITADETAEDIGR